MRYSREYDRDRDRERTRDKDRSEKSTGDDREEKRRERKISSSKADVQERDWEDPRYAVAHEGGAEKREREQSTFEGSDRSEKVRSQTYVILEDIDVNIL